MLRIVFKGMPLGDPTTTWLTMSTETHALKGRRADRGFLLVRTLAGVERLLEANLSNALDRPQDIANGRIPHFVDRNSFVREVPSYLRLHVVCKAYLPAGKIRTSCIA